MLGLSFSHAHMKIKALPICADTTLKTSLVFIPEPSEQLEYIVVLLFSIFFFLCCPIYDLEGQIHGKFISGPTVPNYMM